MNQGLHRVIFNAARGLRMVVAETAVGAGKGNSNGHIAATDSASTSGWRPAVFAIGWTALAALSMLGVAPEVHAQIVPNPFAAAGQKPQVLVAPNGVPLVNITTPSAAGVSINQYNQFDVNAAGAILNNSRTTASTQLGGLVQGNPWLATGPARIIVNQVSSSNPSYLNGYIEVAGQRAEVIIANPSGINVNGGGFINTSRATLTTGTPQFGAMGTLDSFLVQGGTVTIDGNGLDLSTTDYAAILSRALQVNAAIYASELKVVTGANQVSADHAQVTPTAGTGAAPTFALDVSALGGMYAKKITLIGNEAGLGVRNAGSIGASAGNLVVTAAGRLENTGTLEGQSVQLASNGGDIDNRGGTIRQTSTALLAIAAPTLSNTNGGWIGSEPLSAGSGAGTGTTGTTGGTGAAPTGTTGTTGSTGTGSGSGSGSTGTTTAAAPATPPDPGSITAAGAILNDGGKIYAGGPITLQSPNIVNTGGTLSVANMVLNQQSFSNHGGTLNVSGNFSANVGSFDNSTGTVRAGNLNIATAGDLINVDGTLTSDSTATLSVGGKVDNTRGTIAATNTLAANVAGATDNTAGTLAANQGVQLATASLSNDKGAIQASAGPVQLTVTGALNNGQGSIGAGTDLTIQAGSLANASGGGLRAAHDVQVTAPGALTNAGSITAGRNTTLSAGSVQSTTGSVLGAGIQADGSLASAGELNVAATQGLTAQGTNLAAGDVNLQGASVDVGSGTTSAANIALTSTSGNVATSGAKVVTPGTLSITANSNVGQTLVNNAGTVNAGQLQINASNIANTNGGEIVQTGTTAANLAVNGTLNNDGGRIASNSQDLTLSGASITNTGGRIEHAGTGTLAITGGSFSGTNGQITGNGALVVNLSGAFSQDGGKTYADQITVQAGSLSNQGGSIVQGGTGATQISVAGAANNNGGILATNGNLALGAASLSNQGGTLQSGTSADLSLTVSGPLDNSQSGKVISGANSTVNVGSLNNDAGRITAVGDLTATVAAAASNQAGTLAANGNTTVNAGSLNNNGGTTAAVNGNLVVTTSGATTNAGGTLQAGGTTTLSNAGLDNSAGRVFGDSVAVDTHGQQLSNGQGTIAATTTVNLQTGTLLNDAGLIQSGGPLTIDTHGQVLSNTNAVGYTNGQGGITSADTLNIASGNLNNAGGFIGAKGAITANTQQFSNTASGQVFSQDAVIVNTNGGTYDNSGGQTQALGNLTVSGAGVNNTAGLLRSSATTTLNVGSGTVLNNSTQGTNQGIEGENVAITAGGLNNTQGAIRANQNVTATVSGTVDNTNGLMSAGDTLKMADPNAANPGAKTLKVINTGGTLVADKSVVLDAATFSADGTLVSNKDLTVALTQDIVNNGEVVANGNLSYGTTGNLTNNGKLLAGQTLTVSGNVVTNSASGEMSGTNTTVNAGTLNNRGLIDSAGTTRINAGVLNNIGTGRIYGNAVAIGAGQVNNDTETVNGVATAGTIAGRDSVDIGASEVNNREHALIFSGANMAIGGGLDANGKATGQGSTLNNLSATIESLGNMSIATGQVNNLDTHLQITQVTTTGSQTYYATMNGTIWEKLDAQGNVVTWGDPVTRTLYHRNPDGSVIVVGTGYADWCINTQTTTDTAVNADPARIAAGGDLTINGHLENRDSRVVAGGALNVTSAKNWATPGTQTVAETLRVAYGYSPNLADPAPVPLYFFTPPTTTTVAVGAYEYVDHVNATSGYAIGSASVGSNGTGAAGAATASGGTRNPTIVEVAAKVGGAASSSGTGAAAASGASGTGAAGANGSIPMVVRTSTPSASIPNASLYSKHPGSGRYLVVTDPRFAGYHNWLSSDYLLEHLGVNPDTTLQRLGDGFYEQQLIREQIAQLTGYRYLGGYSSDEDQYIALMNAGVTFAQQFGLTPGVALTAAQMAQLTSDIVWLVEQTVTLPDGSTQKVLVPQVYVRVQPGDIDGSGALLAGNQVNIDGKGSKLTNTGTIAGREVVSINASTVDNLNGRISGGQVGIKAQQDINNVGGTIDARDKLVLDAGGSINVVTTTQSTTGGFMSSGTNIDRVAGLYVTGSKGVLVASAGNDINLVGAQIVNQGSGATSFKAGGDINLSTVTTSSTVRGIADGALSYSIDSREVGTTITGGGNVTLDAGHDVNARAATVTAAGDLDVRAGNDITIESGRAVNDTAFHIQTSSKGILTSTTTTVDGQMHSNTAIGSSFSGANVNMKAGQDLNIVGSDVNASGNAVLSAGSNVNIVSAAQETSNDVSYSRVTHGGITPKPGDASFDVMRAHDMTGSVQTQTERDSNVTAGGNLTVTAGKDVNVYASNLTAGSDLALTGQNVNVVSGTEYNSTSLGVSDRRQSVAPTAAVVRTGHGLDNRGSVTNSKESTTLAAATLSGQNVSITATQGDVTLMAATVNAGNSATISAEHGAVNMGVVTTGTTVEQSRGERDLAYQRTRDSGVTTTAANYTQISTGAGGLTLNTPTVNVQVGVPVAYQGNAQFGVPTQTLAQAIADQAGKPGMQWLTQVQNNAQLNNLQINWSGVPLEQRQWAESQGGLTQAGAAVVTVVAAALTWGAASGAGVSAAQGVGFTTTSNGAMATAGGTFFAGAVASGITAVSSMAAVSLINNNGNIAAVLDELGSSQGVRRILTAMVTGGAVAALDMATGLQGAVANNVGVPGSTVTWGDVLARNLMDRTAAALVNTAVNGGNLGDNLAAAISNGLLDTVAAGSAQWLGANSSGLANAVGHAIAGCVAGAGRATAGGYGGSSSDGCSAGAIGAVVGEITANIYNPNKDPALAANTILLSQTVAGIAGAIVGGDQASANIAAAAGANAAENNHLSPSEQRQLDDLKDRCAKTRCTPQELERIASLTARLNTRFIDDMLGDPSVVVDQYGCIQTNGPRICLGIGALGVSSYAGMTSQQINQALSVAERQALKEVFGSGLADAQAALAASPLVPANLTLNAANSYIEVANRILVSYQQSGNQAGILLQQTRIAILQRVLPYLK